jgi:hypothetical protein
VAYDVMKMRSIFPGDVAERRSQGLRFLCAHLQKGTPVVTQSATGAPVRSRMSLGGLLYDSLRQIKAMRAAKLPGVEEVFNRMDYPPFSSGAQDQDRPSPEAELPTASVEQSTSRLPVVSVATVSQAQNVGYHQDSSHIQRDRAPPLSSAPPAASLNIAVDEVGPHGRTEDVPGSARLDLTWDNVDISNLPSIENTEWLQFVYDVQRSYLRTNQSFRLLSVENCTEIMSVPGFDANYNMPWDVQDVSMTDPFNFTASGY